MRLRCLVTAAMLVCISLSGWAQPLSLPAPFKTADYAGGELRIVLDGPWCEKGIQELVSSSGDYIPKDTEFNYVKFSDIRFSLPGRLTGQVLAKHRERSGYNPIAGHYTHTPWVSATGNFWVNFSFGIRDNKIYIYANAADVTLQKRNFFSEMLDHLKIGFQEPFSELEPIRDPHGGWERMLAGKINAFLGNLNGIDLTQMALERLPGMIASKTGKPEGEIREKLRLALIAGRPSVDVYAAGDVYVVIKPGI